MAVRRTGVVSERAKERQRDAAPARPQPEALGSPQHIWRGASGSAYTHTVSSLIFCPEMPEGTYLLLQRDAAGAARVLSIGTLDSKTRSLNLARIRQLGATLGANEVHVRAERTSAAERARIAFDIENALAGSPALLLAASIAAPAHA